MADRAKESRSPGQKIVAIVLPIVAFSMAFYQLVYTQTLLQDPIGHRITHFGFACVVLVLALMLKSKKAWLFKFMTLLCALAVSVYFMVFLEEILFVRSTFPFTMDLIMGVFLIVVVFAIAYPLYGKTFPLLATFSIAYLYFGRYLPYPFQVANVHVRRIIVWLTIPGTEEGIFGDLLAMSANYLFLFLLFGSVLEAFGAGRFIKSVGGWFASKLRCGPAAMPVFSDILLGEITGSTVASIVITGSYTIPLMKKAGYTPAQAGAIETVTSNGGQIMPPIMGATAFVMAGFSGIPYPEIAVAAIIPAFLYYFGAYVYVHIQSRRMPLVKVMEPVSLKQLVIEAPVFVIPLTVLVILIAKGFALPQVIFWSIVSLVVVGLLNSIRRDARLNLKQIIEDVTDGVRTASEMAALIALVGVVATCIKVSGLGIKLPLLVGDISHGYVIIALFITMVSSIILGTGVPTPVAYMLVAIGAIPALRLMGVPVLQAHLFCFMFAVYAHITPPVAMGAMVAANLAGASYWHTAWEAIKMGGTCFILPYFIVYNPVIILRPDVNLAFGIIQVVFILLSITSIQFCLSSYSLVELKPSEQIVYAITAIMALMGLFGDGVFFLWVGMALFVGNLAKQFMRRKTVMGKPAYDLLP